MGHIPLIWRYVTHKINEISSLSMLEYVSIVASFHLSIRGPTIDPDIYTRDYSPEVIAHLEKEAEAKFNPIRTLNLCFSRPLENWPCHDMSFLATLFNRYELGNLPFEGAVCDQPAKVIEALNVIGALKRERESQRRKSDG